MTTVTSTNSWMFNFHKRINVASVLKHVSCTSRSCQITLSPSANKHNTGGCRAVRKNLLVMQQQFTQCHPPSWYLAVNRLENGLLGFIQTCLGLTNGVKRTGRSKSGFSSVWQIDTVPLVNYDGWKTVGNLLILPSSHWPMVSQYWLLTLIRTSTLTINCSWMVLLTSALINYDMQ